ncbi:MAG: NIL domain-containing protein [Dehalococcoidia bacterium]
MATRRVRFTFEPQLIREPFIYQLGHEFRIVTNIRMADVDEQVGWVVLELEGDPDEIERGIQWAEAKGVRVDPLLGDVVEG